MFARILKISVYSSYFVSNNLFFGSLELLTRSFLNQVGLTRLSTMHPSSTHWKNQKTLMFTGGRERVHWEQMG